MPNLIFLTIAANWPKIRHIEKNWVPTNWKLSQLSAELNRFELRPLRAEIFNDKVVRIIITKTLFLLPSIMWKLHWQMCDWQMYLSRQPFWCEFFYQKGPEKMNNFLTKKHLFDRFSTMKSFPLSITTKYPHSFFFAALWQKLLSQAFLTVFLRLISTLR